jgi:hypothetical protein
MKLYLKQPINNKEDIIDVNFWSLMKVTLLCNLLITGIVYGTIFIIVIIGYLLGGL